MAAMELSLAAGRATLQELRRRLCDDPAAVSSLRTARDVEGVLEVAEYGESTLDAAKAAVARLTVVADAVDGRTTGTALTLDDYRELDAMWQAVSGTPGEMEKLLERLRADIEEGVQLTSAGG